jgi:hypothetical protein
MTVECQAAFDLQKRIENLEPRLLDRFKAAHKPGDVIRLIFDDSQEGAHERAFKAFHALRDEYAVTFALDKEYAKALLKFRHGSGTIPWIEGFIPPVGQRGAFLEVEGRIYWMKSTTVYDTEELMVLITGTQYELDQGERDHG